MCFAGRFDFSDAVETSGASGGCKAEFERQTRRPRRILKTNLKRQPRRLKERRDFLLKRQETPSGLKM